MFLNLFRKPNLNRILVCIDLENLLQSLLAIPGPEKLSFLAGYDRIMRQMAREIGEIVDVFVFLPPHFSSIYGKDLNEAGFFTVYCPRMPDKTGEERDTVDETMIRFARKMIRELDITHLCLGTGDRDFTSLAREAIRNKLKIIVMAASNQSLALDLAKLADRVFLFSPTE